MKVILLSEIKGEEKKDQVIEASDGYARNFLFPKKLAVEANNANMSKLKAKQESKQFRKDNEKREAEELARKLKGIMLKIRVKAGENGKIFGGVTSKEISEGLKREYNIEIDKKKINLTDTVKTLGTILVDIRLYEGVIGNLKVDIISE